MSKRDHKVTGGEQLCTGWLAAIQDWKKKPWLRKGPRPYRKFLKRRKRRAERRKARRNPETHPTYGRYNGYD